MSERPPEEPPFLKRLLEEVSKQLERHPLHDETAHREMLDGLSQSFGSLTPSSPELTVIEGGDDDAEALSSVPSNSPELQLFSSDEPAESSVRDDLLQSLSSVLDGGSDSDIHVEVLTWPSFDSAERPAVTPGQILLAEVGQEQKLLIAQRCRMLRIHCLQGHLVLEGAAESSKDRVSAELFAGQTIDVECRSLTAIAQSASSSGWFQQISATNVSEEEPSSGDEA